MGQQQSQIVYSKAVSEKKEGETEIRRPLESVDQLCSTPIEGMDNLQKVWLRSVKLFGSQNYIYRRGKDGKYKGRTYAEFHDLCMQLGSGVQHLNIAPVKNEYKDLNLQLVGVYAKNREEWIMLDVGLSYLFGMTLVPLYDSLGPENVSYCIEHSGLETCFASTESIDTIIKTENLAGLKSVVALDDVTEQQRKSLELRGLIVYTFQQILDIGKQNPKTLPEISPNQISTFSYTSGTTGKPKAAMLSHSNFVSSTSIFVQNPALVKVVAQIQKEGLPISHLSYLPLPHVFERVVFCCISFLGGCVYMYSGDVLKLKQDIMDVKPTIFVSVPRLYNKFYDAINKQFDEQPLVKRFLIKTAIEAKAKNIQQNCSYDHALWDNLIFKKIREGVFGGNVRVMISGSAPLSKDVLNFFQIILSAPLMEGYGQTENTGAAFIKSCDDSISGHIGGPFGNLEFKLVDVPEMNYLSTDKDANGKDLPRGELCTRGPGVFPGYYKDEEKTKEAIDEEGWLHSGDIASFERDTTRVRIIDRKKNIFKLSQGEYVAPEKIENVYLKVKGISEVFVYGNSLQSSLVGIIVPEKPFVEELALSLKIEGQFEDLCQNEEIIKNILKNLNDQGKQDKLFGFEQVRAIHLEPQSLQTKGCFTSTMKLQRHLAKEVFQKEIENLYQKV